MSRIGNKPVPVIAGVKVAVSGRNVSVEGPKGKLQAAFPPEVTIAMENNAVVVKRGGDTPRYRAMHGLTRALINNMVQGVTKGYQKILEVHGVGYTAKKQGTNLVLAVGFANQITLPIPAGVDVAVTVNAKDKNVADITITGADKQAVGQMAAMIRRTRPPEPYKQKGIRYRDEVVMKKQGKAMATG